MLTNFRLSFLPIMAEAPAISGAIVNGVALLDVACKIVATIWQHVVKAKEPLSCLKEILTQLLALEKTLDKARVQGLYKKQAYENLLLAMKGRILFLDRMAKELRTPNTDGWIRRGRKGDSGCRAGYGHVHTIFDFLENVF